MKFQPVCRVEADEWTCDGEKICAPEKIEAIKKTLREVGPILVQHSFLRAARGPRTLAFDGYEEFIEYLEENARAGDHVTVWSVWSFMRDTPPFAHGKCPAEDGAVPKKGAY